MVAQQLEIDTVARMRRARTFLGVMVGVTMAGIVWDTCALFSLGINAGVWLAWFINKSGAIRELALDDSVLLTKEDQMKKN